LASAKLVVALNFRVREYEESIVLKRSPHLLGYLLGL
jgi:hypothetical protein